ncbi:PepSY domain-containing protein [Chryseobacterium oncorhynchi]|uniref:Uncharacterized protein n=1 Tax=Chryseobacterium oncorhynchi TaxID=741074 RepID=A0A316X0Y3_9FLAO|nr:PepSY domain-containing protein [Chryseobacterium oncorhynchi]PWN64570.1 hypothetical protein C1638_011825 [Chryseobacterium oncorhynchi]
MITKEKALEIVKQYLQDRKREYVSIAEIDKIYMENKVIGYGKYEDTKRNVFVVSYKIEGYPEPIPQFVIVDAEKGEVLFTSTKHGYAEEWEDDDEL